MRKLSDQQLQRGGDWFRLTFGQTYLAGTITFHVGPGGGTFFVFPVFVGGDGLTDCDFCPPPSPTLNGAYLIISAVPEPITAGLLALGLGGLAFARRCRNN